jgi:hypothetical protein
MPTEILVVLPARFCRACGAPSPFLSMPICQVCLAKTLWVFNQLMEELS